MHTVTQSPFKCYAGVHMIASHARTFLELFHPDNSIIKERYLNTSAVLNQDNIDVVELSTEELD